MNKKIIILFPDGVGIKNYLYSDVFKDVENDLVLAHNFDHETEKKIKEFSKIKTSFKLPNYSETLFEKFLRELICLSRLKYNSKLVSNPTILLNWKKKHNGFGKMFFYFLITFCANFITKYKNILWLEVLYDKKIRNTRYYHKLKTIIKEVAPAKIFCTHQRGIQCAPFFAVARDLGIECITVIYSWDNLPKARMALRADKYLVWSEYMKNELNMYYPEINMEQIEVTGTPQFEFYTNPQNIISKDEFYKKYNLDLNKKIICYSGDDELTSPDDPKYLNDLADEIVKNKLKDKYQILLRRCPVDVSGRFDYIIEKYPELIKQAVPEWNFERFNNWTTVYPLPDDIRLLVSTAYYCDVVVNLGSTMAFDFAMFQKPCIYINYNQKEKRNIDWSVETIYKYQHFRSMPNVEVVYWWNFKDEIVELLNKLHYNRDMNDWTRIVLGQFENSSSKIKKILNN